MDFHKLKITLGLLCLFPLLGAAQTFDAPAEDWIQMFNGENLDGWEFKVRYLPIGEDPNNTFYVENGVLYVDYSNYNGFSGEPFSHIWYTEREFSHYVIMVQYNFVGDQVSGGPGWAKQNNGIMFHAQSIESMSMDQDFPVSIELQLLGTQNNQNNDGTTANLCTPGTKINGGASDPHCQKAQNVSQAGLEWVTAGALVLGDSLVKHIVQGDTVMEYGDLVFDNGTPLTKGYITLQGESAPYQFKKVEILDLVGCKDETAANYKDYLVVHDPETCEAGVAGCMDTNFVEYNPEATFEPDGACEILASQNAKLSRNIKWNAFENTLYVPDLGSYRVVVGNVNGKIVEEFNLSGNALLELGKGLEAGLYFIRVLGSDFDRTEKMVLNRGNF